MRVIFLGSGGSLPTPRRNLPSVCLLREGEMMLFDCGEGTQTQIMRKGVGFGRLTRIFISHIHGDHLSGLIGLLMTLTLLGHEHSITIYGPPEVEDFIESLKRTIRLRCDFGLRFEAVKPGVFVEEKEYTIEAAEVNHSVPTYAFALRERVRPGRFNLEKAKELGIPEGPLFSRLQQGESITLESGRVVEPGEILGPARPGRGVVYVTDTLYTPSLADFCRGADLLMHEGMFTDEMEEEARYRKHCTASQAATLARAAEVKRLVLIHISPRYWRRKELRDEARRVFPDTDVAKDLMEIEVPYPPE
ncbi:MAG: ribonuclease Z [bacterium]